MENDRDVVITGIGLLSSLGEGVETHLRALTSGAGPNLDLDGFAPYPIHPLPEIDWSRQIPKRGDLRQMETWQRLGTYAAGLALADAAIPEDEGVRSRIDMIVSAGGGERDLAVDAMVIDRVRTSSDRGSVVNETLANELRPTLFLAQLSNLLAGNISIVHKVTGSSRTFMGEEAAGISALSAARARVAAGQSQTCLVGGAFSAARKDLLLNFELAELLLHDEWAPVGQRRAPHDGIALGSVGAFLVLESAKTAQERGARVYARLGPVSGDRGRRDPDATRLRLDRMLDGVTGVDLVLSGATGLERLTKLEQAALDERLPEAPVRSFGNLLGHSFEAHLPAGVALAAALLASGQSARPLDGETERAEAGPASRILVTALGHLHGEGLCLLDRYAA